MNVVLQGSQVTLDEEVRLLEQLLLDIQRMRDSWENILKESRLVAVSFEIEPTFKISRKNNTREFHGEEGSNGWSGRDEDEYRVKVYNVCIDRLSSEIQQRMLKARQVDTLFSFLLRENCVDHEAESAAKALAEAYPLYFSVQTICNEMTIQSTIKKTLWTEGGTSLASELETP